MGDYNYQHGVNHGQEDIICGKGNCASTRYLKRRFNWDQFLPGADNRYNNYTDGYRLGQNNELTTINTKLSSAGDSQQQSLYSQGLWCYQTIKNLTKLNEEIKKTARSYHVGIEDLKDQSYLGELLGEIIKGKNDFINKCDALITSVENEHVTYIEKRLNKIEDVLNETPK